MIKGKQFNRLTALWKSKKKTKWGRPIWVCRCMCGNLIEVSRNSLITGNTKSCGCLNKEKRIKHFTRINKSRIKHGDCVNGNSRLYGAWSAMKFRCLNPKSSRYHRYGGRGIKICPEWQNSYLAFKKWALANGYKPTLSIDRINNDGNYEPSNCQWITLIENRRKH